jgi:hypothetical protein
MKSFMKYFSAGLVLGLVSSPLASWAGGWVTANLPVIGAATVNGTVQTNGNGVVSQVNSVQTLAADSQLASGVSPQTVSVTAFQIAGIFAEALNNTATSTAAAATLNRRAGVVTTESLSTAVGATYTFTLTNSLFTATSVPQVALYPLSSTVAGITLTSSTCASGSCVFVFTNTGTAAWNGTMNLVFHI